MPAKISSPQVKTPKPVSTQRKAPQKFSPIKKLPQKNVITESPRYKEILDSETESESSVRSDDSWKDSDSDCSSNTDNDSPLKKESITKKSMRVSHRVFHISDESEGDSDKDLIKRVDEEKLRKDRQRELLEKLDSFEYKKLPGVGTPKTDTKSKRKLFTHSHFEEDFEDLSLENDKEKENKKPEVCFS